MPVDFPPPEPWPAELFSEYGLADLEQLSADVNAEIAWRKHEAANQTAPPRAIPDGQSVEGQEAHMVPINRFLRDYDKAVAALTKPTLVPEKKPASNVVDLHSRKVK